MAKAKTDLVIVESPAKARTIEKYLGNHYQVVASMGHLRDLPKSTMGVDIDGDFTPQYLPVKDRADVIADLKKRAKSADTVYLATDPDREGEAISWHLKELLDLPDDKAKRVTFNEITKKVVTESIQHPREIDQDLVDAQQARRILDRIVHSRAPCLHAYVINGPMASSLKSLEKSLQMPVPCAHLGCVQHQNNNFTLVVPVSRKSDGFTCGQVFIPTYFLQQQAFLVLPNLLASA